MKAPRNFKRLIGFDWDFAYLLELEQYKFKRMAKYFAKSQLVEDWRKQVSTCNLLVKLLDIILEKDAAYQHWSDMFFGKDKRDYKFPRHINTRNYTRFAPEGFVEKEGTMKAICVVDLRVQKAWYLYHKLRYYKMQQLWD